MTIEEQCDVAEKELHLARTTLLALQSRNADTDYDRRRVVGMEAVLRTLAWCRDNAETIKRVYRGD